jgi:hypothetical protein
MSTNATKPYSGSVGTASPVKEPPVDGTLEVKGPYGKCVVLLELSEGMNSAHIETKIGQRRYIIDIRPSPGSDTTPQFPLIERFLGNPEDDRS